MKKTIKEIKEALANVTSAEHPFFNECLQDERRGVQQLIKQKYKEFEMEEKLAAQFNEMRKLENALYEQGYEFIAGIDEVGRGPLAGPVVASAVILPKDFYLAGLTDSKKLSEQKREEFYEIIQEKAVAVGVGIADVEIIDEINIYEATKRAMAEAVKGLSIEPQYLLLDAMNLPLPLPQQSIIKGDAKSVSIAASSVIAKVTRDRMMKKLGQMYPQYGFEKHMGYGTKQHLEAIHLYGVIPEHRKTFSPIKELLLK